MKKILLLVIFVLFLPSIGFADEIIKGHYCYTYGDNESLKEARELTRTLAIRDAIESYRVFVESTSTVKNFKLTNDLIQMITSGYLKNVKVLKHTEKGRTICETIQASISPKAVENIIKREVRKRTKKVEALGLDNNGYLKILKVKNVIKGDVTWKKLHDKELHIKVIVKVLQRTGSLYVSRYQNVKPYFKICVDFFDSDGDPVGGKSQFIHKSSTEMLPGEIKAVYFGIPSDAKSWRVWLPK
jgi:hypothetical protein